MKLLLTPYMQHKYAELFSDFIALQTLPSSTGAFVKDSLGQSGINTADLGLFVAGMTQTTSALYTNLFRNPQWANQAVKYAGVAVFAGTIANDLYKISIDLNATHKLSDSTIGSLTSDILALSSYVTLALTGSATIPIILAVTSVGVAYYTLAALPDNSSEINDALISATNNLLQSTHDFFKENQIAFNQFLDTLSDESNNGLNNLIEAMSKPFLDFSLGLSDGLMNIDNKISTIYSSAVTVLRRDPLTIDLDGDGIETVGISTSSPILFDATGDGIKTATGWIKADDGLLVLDRNGNGTIDSGLELFGDSTRLSNGQLATNGFEALADLDSNHDGAIDSNDAQFSDLRIWQDLNQDGISQQNELFTLTEKGITSLNLNYTANLQTLSNSNQIAELGTYTKADGTTSTLGSIADVNLIQDTFQSQFVDSIQLSDLAMALPDIAGAGQVRSLREAATLSTELSNLLTAYKQPATHAQQVILVDQIIKAWSDTSQMKSSFDQHYTHDQSGNEIPVTITVTMQHVASGSSQYNDIKEKLSILEKFNGRTFRPIPVDATSVTFDVYSSAQTLLTEAYDRLHYEVFQMLWSQTRLEPLLDLVSLSIDENGIGLDFSSLNAELNARLANNGIDGFADFVNFNLFTINMLQDTDFNGYKNISDYISTHPLSEEMLDVLRSSYVLVNNLNPIYFYGTDKDDFEVGLSANETMFGGFGNDVIYGNAGDDRLEGQDGADKLYGCDGNDYIYGGNGDDYIDGGAGNDTLIGQAGSDTYLFDIGSGQDLIYNNLNDSWNNSVDTIQLGEFISPDNITLTRNGVNLIIGISGTTDTATLVSYFSSTDETQIRFFDGTIWSLPQIAPNLKTFGTATSDSIYAISNQPNDISGLSGNDTIYGGSQDDKLYGDDGNDILYGKEGNDYLIGGRGNDILTGGTGSDIYQFNLGDGQDIIKNTATDTGSNAVLDKIVFAQGITSQQVSVQRTGNDLKLLLDNSTDSIIVSDHFYSSNRSINQVEFSDGTVWNKDYLIKLGQYIGTDSNDYMYAIAGVQNNLYGMNGNDKLTGAELSDRLYGGNGSDTILGNSGDDYIVGGAGNDLLTGGAGSDVYQFNLGDGQDIIYNMSSDAPSAKNDVLLFEDLIPSDHLWFTKTGNDLSVSVIGTTDKVTISNWFLGETYRVDQFQAGDGKNLNDENVQTLLNVMSTLTPPPLGQTNLSEYQHQALQSTLSDVWI